MTAGYETRTGARTPTRPRPTGLLEGIATEIRGQDRTAWIATLSLQEMGDLTMGFVVARRHPDAETEAEAEPTVTPEQTLREAGIAGPRQAAYQRKMSTLLAGNLEAALGRERMGTAVDAGGVEA